MCYVHCLLCIKHTTLVLMIQVIATFVCLYIVILSIALSRAREIVSKIASCLRYLSESSPLQFWVCLDLSETRCGCILADYYSLFTTLARSNTMLFATGGERSRACMSHESFRHSTRKLVIQNTN